MQNTKVKNEMCKCGRVHEGEHSPHYNEGTNREIAFVFSCPGRLEKDNCFPISGETGETFFELLKLLREKGLIKENFHCRYDFRITNATENIEYKKRTDKSEANNSDVIKDKNIQRLFDEIKDYDRIICFGKKAKLAVSKMTDKLKNHHISYVRHLSTQAFINEKGIDKTREGRAWFVFNQISTQNAD
jgi:hypothetical protein